MLGIIYSITNTVNGKKYIGQTVRPLEKRWTQHQRDSNRHTYHFARAIK